MKIFNIIGLSLNFIGSVILVVNGFVSKKDAIAMGTSAWLRYKDEENLKAPMVKPLLRQSYYSKIGIVILAIGFFIQLIATVLS